MGKFFTFTAMAAATAASEPVHSIRVLHAPIPADLPFLWSTEEFGFDDEIEEESALYKHIKKRFNSWWDENGCPTHVNVNFDINELFQTYRGDLNDETLEFHSIFYKVFSLAKYRCVTFVLYTDNEGSPCGCTDLTKICECACHSRSRSNEWCLSCKCNRCSFHKKGSRLGTSPCGCSRKYKVCCNFPGHSI